MGKREYTSLLLLAMGLKLADTTPSLLFEEGKTAAWMMPLVSLVLVGVSFMVLMSVLKKHPDKGLMELSFELAGSYGGAAIGLILFLTLLPSTVFNSRSYVDIINVMVYQKTPVPALYIMLMLAAYYVGSRGFSTIGRSSWIVIVYIEFLVALLVVFVWRDIEWLHLYPIAGPGFGHVLREGAMHSAILGEVILLTVLVPFVRTLGDFKSASYWGFGLSAVKIAGMMAVYLAVFDYPEVVDIAFPFHQLTRTASVGQIITHVESIFLAFWLITCVIHFAIYVCLLAFLLGRSLRLPEFLPLILPLSGLVVLLGLFAENLTQVTEMRDWMVHGSTFIYLLLPFLLWGLDQWKRRTKGEKV